MLNIFKNAADFETDFRSAYTARATMCQYDNGRYVGHGSLRGFLSNHFDAACHAFKTAKFNNASGAVMNAGMAMSLVTNAACLTLIAKAAIDGMDASGLVGMFKPAAYTLLGSAAVTTAIAAGAEVLEPRRKQILSTVRLENI